MKIFNRLIVGIVHLLPKKFVWQISKKYISGDSLSHALNASKSLNTVGYLTTVDLLGEYIIHIEEAKKNKNDYIEIIETLEKHKINGNYSLKPTFLGLLIDEEQCYNFVKEIVEKAAQFNNMIRIDMEHSACTSLEIKLFKRLYEEFPNNVGLVFQSYLKRTKKDIENLIKELDIEALNFRICKGIYNEHKNISYKKYAEINDNFIDLLELLFQNKIYTGIATHDNNLLKTALGLIKKYEVPKNKYEFQMLYGVTPKRRLKLLNAGHPLRVYIPFGKHWYGYSIRRLRENPKLTYHIIKSIFR